MNNNDDVMIGSPGASPRVRATFNTSPTRRYAYTNSNTNENNIGQIRTRVIDPNNLRRMRRARMSFDNVGPVRRRLSFGNNGNRQNSSNYIKNENQMKKNANENNKTKKIQWKKVSVKNLPIDVISTNNFKSGEKAVKINKLYLTPNSFRKLARMSMTKAINSNGNMVLFKNPLTRENVKKGDLKFVILKREVKK
jgi:virulence-associated protein VapD